MSNAPPVMLGLELPDVDVWSDRVVVALGKNPGAFTGPGTNTFLVGTGRRRILLDTGDGRKEYLPVLSRALETAGCEIQEILLTHSHADHIGGASSVMDLFGAVSVSKFPGSGDHGFPNLEIREIGDGAVIETEGATLRALHTPGHAGDHLCFMLEEERALFSGDNVLGVGTTMIPAEAGNLEHYMDSLHTLLSESPAAIYPAHGPLIEDGTTKIREYIDHRNDREAQIVAALCDRPRSIPAIVEVVYAAYPKALYAAAGESVCAHLMKLEREGRAVRRGDAKPIDAIWQLT